MHDYPHPGEPIVFLHFGGGILIRRYMNSEDVISIYQWLGDSGIQSWIVGGWGIDALLGEQTRDHHDLDLIILVDDVTYSLDLCASEGYLLDYLWEENNPVTDSYGNTVNTGFVLRDGSGRELDIHAMRLDAQGNGIPAWKAARGWIFSTQDLSGKGRIAGEAVRCFSPDMQRKAHTGYDLPDHQRCDLELLDRHIPQSSPKESPSPGLT
jgi:lincosamide nucleotidyltransferase A/C/D/E